MNVVRSLKRRDIYFGKNPVSDIEYSVVARSAAVDTGLKLHEYDSPASAGQRDSATRAETMVRLRSCLRPVAQLCLSLVILAATLGSIALIHQLLPLTHPPVALLVLPVIAAGMLFGRLYGLSVLLTALVAARLLFFPIRSGLEFQTTDDILTFGSLASAMVGSSVVALYAHKMSRDAKMTEARCHTFNRDVLLAVTSGRLVLCEGDEIRELAGGLSVQISTAEVAADLHGVREVVRQSVRAYLSEEKVGDLLTCVTEATTNALKYAGSASLETWIGTDAVSVVVSDSGAGIDPSLLARATLESGFSTTNTLGMGFTLMLAMADKIALHTSDHGTQVLIRINR